MADTPFLIIAFWDRPTIVIGDKGVLSVLLTNDGPTPLTNVHLVIPAVQNLKPLEEAVFVTTESSGAIQTANYPEYKPADGFALPDIAVNETLIVEVSYLMSTEGNYIVTPEISYDWSPDADTSAQNYSTSSTAALLISKSELNIYPDKFLVADGEHLTYTVVARNSGSAAWDCTAMTVSLPLQFEPDEPFAFAPFRLDSLQEKIFMFPGTVKTPVDFMKAFTSATFADNENPAAVHDFQAGFAVSRKVADISLNISADQSSVYENDMLTYTLTVTNGEYREYGSFSSIPTISVALPPVLSAPEYSLDGETFSPWTDAVTLDPLPFGRSTNLYLRALFTGSVEDSFTTSAQVTGSAADANPTNNTASLITAVNPSARLSVSYTVPSAADEQNLLTCSYTVHNAGPSAAENVILSIGTDAELLNAVYMVTNINTVWQPWTGSLNLGTVSAQSSVTVYLRVNAAEIADGQTAQGSTSASILAGTVSVLSSTMDHNAAANSSSLETDILAAGTSDPNPATIESDTSDLNSATIESDTSDQNPATIESDTSDPNSVNIESDTSDLNSDAANNPVSWNAWAYWPGAYPTPSTGTADLVLSSSFANTSISSSDVLHLTLTVTNLGPDAAVNPTFSNMFPEGSSAAEFSLDGQSWQSWMGYYTLSSLDSGASFSLQLRAQLTSTVGASLVNTAYIGSFTNDSSPYNNWSIAVATVEDISDTPSDPDIPSNADLNLTSSLADDHLHPGDMLQLTLMAENLGPDAAEHVVINCALPDGLASPEFSLDGQNWQFWTGSFELGTLDAGSSASLQLRAQVTAEAETSLTSTASVDSAAGDPCPHNNSSSVVIDVVKAPLEDPSVPADPSEPSELSADLSLHVIDSPNPVNCQEQLTYIFTVHNDGPSEAQDILLTDTFSSHLDSPQFSLDGGDSWQAWTGSCSLGSLQAADSLTVLIRCKVLMGESSTGKGTGILTNSARISASTSDPDMSNNTVSIQTTVTELADLAIAASVSPNPAVAGELVTFKLAVTNFGPCHVMGATVLDDLPAHILNPEFSMDSVSWEPWTGSCMIHHIMKNQTVDIFIRGALDPDAVTAVTNTASVSALPVDRDATNNASSAVLDVISYAADLQITHLGSTEALNVGDSITYTVIVKNLGPDDAASAVLRGDLAANLATPEVSNDGGVTWGAWTGSYDAGSLLVNDEITILIRGTVQPTPLSTPLMQTIAARTAATDSTDPADSTDPTATTTATDSNATSSNATTTTTASTTAAAATTTTTATASTIPSVITSTLSVGSSTKDPTQLNNIATVASAVVTAPQTINTADLALSSVASADSLVPGDMLHLTLMAENLGPDAAEHVVISATLPDGLTSPEFSLDGENWQPWTDSFELGTLDAGSSASLQLRAQVTAEAGIVLVSTAYIDSDTSDPSPHNNFSIAAISVPKDSEVSQEPSDPSADLSLYVIDSPNPVNCQEKLTYIFTVYNNGPSKAQDVLLTDTFSSHLDSPQFSLDGGTSWQPWTGSCSLGSLPAAGSLTVLTRCKVLMGETSTGKGTGILTNSAIISSSTPDPDMNNNTVSIQTTVTELADLAIAASVSPNPAVAGELVTFKLAVTNFGPCHVMGATVLDDLPAHILNPEFSMDSVSWEAWTGSCMMGHMMKNQTVDIFIRGTLDPDAVMAVTNTASVSALPVDRDATNNASTVVLDVISYSADLQITYFGSTESLNIGDSITYTVIVKNFGPDDATSAVIRGDLAANLTTPEVSKDGGITWEAWTGSYDAGSLLLDEEITILIRGTVQPTPIPARTRAARTAAASITSTTPPVITSTLSVGSSTKDPTELNNIATVASAVVTTSQTIDMADLAVTASVGNGSAQAGDSSTQAGDGSVQAGETVTFILTASNDGPADASDVTVTSAVSARIENPLFSLDEGASWEAWTGSYTFATMSASARQSLLLRGTVSEDAIAPITLAAAVSSSLPDPDSSNNFTTAILNVIPLTIVPLPVSDLALNGVASSTNPVPGDTLTLTITAVNNGPDAAVNSIISGALPDDLTSTEISLDGQNWQPWTGSFELGTLDAGSSATIYVRGIVDAPVGTVLISTVTIDSDCEDINCRNNSFTMGTGVVATPVNPVFIADLKLSGAASSESLSPGDTLTLTLTATNNSLDSAEHTVIHGSFPDGLMSLEVSLDCQNWQPWTGDFELGALNAGSSAIIYVRGIVDAPVGTVLASTLNITSDTEDPDVHNNIFSVNTAVVSPPIDPLPVSDLALNGVASSDSLSSGDTLTLTITAVNNGPDAAENTTISGALPDGLKSPEVSLDGQNWQPWTGGFELGTLDAGSSAIIYVRGVVDAPAGTIFIHTLSAASDSSDPVCPNSFFTIGTSVLPPSATLTADLKLTSSITGDTFHPGDTLHLTLMAENLGPNAAEHVVLSAVLPDGLTSPEFSLDGQNWQPWTGSFELGTLDAGSSASLQLRAQVTAEADTVLVSTAYIDSDASDLSPHNNFGTAAISVTKAPEEPQEPSDPSADLSLHVIDSPNPVSCQELLTYIFTVRNSGPSEAQDIVLTDTFASYLVNSPQFSLDGGISWQPWTGSCSLGSLQTADSLTVLVRCKVLMGESSTSKGTGILTNTARISSSTPDPNMNNNTASIKTTVTELADLAIAVSASPNPAVAGELVTFTLAVTNLGPCHVMGVTVVDELPAQILNPEVSMDSTSWEPWTGSYMLHHMMEYQTVNIFIRGTLDPDAVTAVTNMASVSASPVDLDATNNTSSVILDVISYAADLQITYFGSTEALNVGDPIIYTVIIKNFGPDDATSTVLRGDLAANLATPEVSKDGGIIWEAWTGSYDAGSLPVNEEITILIRGTLQPTPTPTPPTQTRTARTAATDSADASSSTAATAPAAAATATAFTAATVLAATTATASISAAAPAAAASTATTTATAAAASTTPPVITSTLSVGSSTKDPAEFNNIATVASAVVTAAQTIDMADLAITAFSGDGAAQDGESSAQAGEAVTFTLTASNNGPAGASDVTVTSAVSARIENPLFSLDEGVSWEPWSGSYTYASMPASAQRSLLLRGTVSENAIAPITFTSIISSPLPDSDSSNNFTTAILHIIPLTDRSGQTDNSGDNNNNSGQTGNDKDSGNNSGQTCHNGNNDNGNSAASNDRGHGNGGNETMNHGDHNENSVNKTDATPVADLSLAQAITSGKCAYPDSRITYTIWITNAGPFVAEDVILTDDLSADIVDIFYSTDFGSTWSSWKGVLSLGNLASGALKTVYLRGKIAASPNTVIQNTAQVYSSTIDPDGRNNIGSVSATVSYKGKNFGI